MPSAKAVRIQATPRAEALLAKLIIEPFEFLSALPLSEVRKLDGYPKPVALTTYRDTQPNGNVKIVVQLAVTGWLGTASFWVEGFELAMGGKPVKLPSDQLYDFH